MNTPNDLLSRKVVGSCVLALASALLASPLAAQVVFQEDFESDTVGNQPSAFTVSSPATNTGATDNPPVASDGGPRGAVVVPFGSVGNPAGTGNALRIYDFDGTGNVNVSTDFTGIGLMRFDFAFSSDQFTGTSGNSFLRIGFGTQGLNVASSSSTTVMGRVVVARNGGSTSSFQVRNNTTDTTVLSNFTLQDSHLVSIFANTDDAASANYNFGGAQSIASNTYDVYFDGVLVADDFAFRSGSTSGLDNIEAIGFATGGSQTGPDWVIDDIEVSAVPEPASSVLVGLGAVALCFLRKRRD